MNRFLPIRLFAALPIAHGAMAANPSSYTSQHMRDVKALSRQDVDDLMSGRGMGLAKAAELNGYPGPAHILELAAKLGLTPEQVHAVAAIKERMSGAARALGAEIVGRERDLDRQFAGRTITEGRLAANAEAIGTLYGRLRSIHLAAHIEARRVLTPEQVARYNELRGYASARHPRMHGHPPSDPEGQ